MKKIKDHYFHKAKRDGYVARSAYKLEEIDKKNRLLRKGNLVLDLGCSPGSWLQYAAGKVGEKGIPIDDLNKTQLSGAKSSIDNLTKNKTIGKLDFENTKNLFSFKRKTSS